MDRSPRVLMLSQQVHPIPPQGGAAVEQWIDAVANAMERWEPLIVSVEHPDRPDSERVGRVCYERIRMGWLYVRLFRKLTRLDPWSYLDRIAALARRFEPDLIHLHNAPELVRGLASRMPRVPIVLHMHNTLPLQSSEHIAALIGCSRYVADWYRQSGVNCPLIDVVPNGVNTERLKPSDPSKRALLRTQRGIPVDRFLIMYVGRMAEEKGPDRLVEAFSRLPTDRFHMVLVGGWTKSRGPGDKRGSYADRLSQQVAKLREGSVTVLGLFPPDEAQQLYGLGDLLVIPSRFEEPFSMVAIEAMASGVPVLAVKRGGMPEYMRDGINALLVEGDSSPEAIADAIEAAASDSGRMKRIALEARQMVEARFSWDEVARQTQGLYDRILGSTGSS